MEKGKSGAAPETPRAKSEEKSAGPGKAAETKETKGRNIPASVSETKTGSTVEPRDRKSPRLKKKLQLRSNRPRQSKGKTQSNQVLTRRKGRRQVQSKPQRRAMKLKAASRLRPIKRPRKMNWTAKGNPMRQRKRRSRENKRVWINWPLNKV
jgi:hypothetical protein